MLTLNRFALEKAIALIRDASADLGSFSGVLPGLSMRRSPGLKIVMIALDKAATLEKVAASLETILKDEAPQPVVTESDGYADGYPVWEFYCPNCEYSLGEADDPRMPYCPACGQALDWSAFSESEETNDAK